MLRRADFLQGWQFLVGSPLSGMNRAQLPPDVVQFLLDKVDSVPQLEALLLLHAFPETIWSRSTIGERLYVSERDVVVILAKLTRSNLLLELGDGTFRFNLQSSDAGVVRTLSEHYQKHLAAIARIIHEKPAPALREFAQAFNVTKGE